MKKFEFSLSRMLDYKDRIFEEERGRLQRLRAEKEDLERRIGESEEAFREISRKMQKAQEQGTTVLELRGFSLQLTNIRRHMEQLRELLEAAEQRVERQTRVVVAANQEVSKLDKLQDKQLEVYRKEAEKAEELRIEELVTLNISRGNAV